MSSPYEADSVVLPDERAVVVATGGLAVAGYVAGEALVDDRAAVELAARLMDQPETAVDLSRPELGTLLADNLQSLIRNPKRYLQIFGDDGSAFEPFRNHPPETVLVETADGIRTRILDGIHRLSGYFVHHDAIRARYPDFQFTIHNLTDRYARPDGPAGGRAITMAEYLRLVVPPNVAQERIAPDRLAAILITSWEDLVGRRIASHFSALAAFSVLDAERLAAIRSGDGSAGDRQYYVGETQADRAQIDVALRSMAGTIEESGIRPRRILERAYRLITSHAESIGGREASQQQLVGLVRHPVVQWKLAAEVGNNPEFVAVAENTLRTMLWQLFEAPQPKDCFAAVYAVLVDPQVTFHQAREVIAAAFPARRYRALQAEMANDALAAAYRAEVGVGTVTPTESRLLALHRRLTDEEPAVVREGLWLIREAAAALRRADSLVLQLQESDIDDDRLSFVTERVARLSDAAYGVQSIDDMRAQTELLADFLLTCQNLLPVQGSAPTTAEAGDGSGRQSPWLRQGRQAPHRNAELFVAETPTQRFMRAIALMQTVLESGKPLGLGPSEMDRVNALRIALARIAQDASRSQDRQRP